MQLIVWRVASQHELEFIDLLRAALQSGTSTVHLVCPYLIKVNEVWVGEEDLESTTAVSPPDGPFPLMALATSEGVEKLACTGTSNENDNLGNGFLEMPANAS